MFKATVINKINNCLAQKYSQSAKSMHLHKSHALLNLNRDTKLPTALAIACTRLFQLYLQNWLTFDHELLQVSRLWPYLAYEVQGHRSRVRLMRSVRTRSFLFILLTDKMGWAYCYSPRALMRHKSSTKHTRILLRITVITHYKHSSIVSDWVRFYIQLDTNRSFWKCHQAVRSKTDETNKKPSRKMRKVMQQFLSLGNSHNCIDKQISDLLN